MNKKKSSINTWEEFYEYLNRPLPIPINTSKLENLCVWHISALDESSTTFVNVCYYDKENPLYKCAYECPTGINYNCKQFMKLNKSNEK